MDGKGGKSLGLGVGEIRIACGGRVLTMRVADASDIIPSPQGGSACTTMGKRQCPNRVRIGSALSALFPCRGFVGAERWWSFKVPNRP